jgi:hypothetical protein
VRPLARTWAVVLASAFAVVLFVPCAKKMLPPSPDRFAPHLEEIDMRNRSQVELVFDEEIDPARVVADSFNVTGPDGRRLELRGASLGRQADRVLLWTPVQAAAGLYELRGVVWDRAGNLARFRGRFRGSEKRDSIAPRVVRVEPSPGAAGLRRGVAVRVKFSEPVDTSGTLSFMFVPARYDTLFKSAWDPDWQGLGFVNRESMPGGAVVYFMLQPGVKDLEGNRTRGAAFTYFTSDSVLEAQLIRGKAEWRNGPLGTGTVFFHAESLAETAAVEARTAALAAVLRDGSFFTKVRQGSYEVEAVADTDGDGLVDLSSTVARFRTEQESLELTLEPAGSPRPISAYRR